MQMRTGRTPIVSVTYLVNRMQVLAAGKNGASDKQTSAGGDGKDNEKDYGDNTAITPPSPGCPLSIA